jgi:hypothetical protein
MNGEKHGNEIHLVGADGKTYWSGTIAPNTVLTFHAGWKEGWTCLYVAGLPIPFASFPDKPMRLVFGRVE